MNANLDVVGTCINCFTRGSLTATLLLIGFGAIVAWFFERRRISNISGAR